MVEILIGFLNRPVSVTEVIVLVLFWFFWDVIFKRNLVDNIIRNLFTGIVFVSLAASGHLTIWLASILFIPLFLLSVSLEAAFLKTKENGDGNNRENN